MFPPTVRFAAGLLAITLSAAPGMAQPAPQVRALAMPRGVAASRLLPASRDVALARPAIMSGGVALPSAPAIATQSVAGTGRTLLGATAGAVLGALAGAMIGAATASDAAPCQNGDPDGCLGAQLPSAIWGTGVGITLATPLGAHLGNRSQGNLAHTALASAALFLGEVIVLRSMVEDGRTEHKTTVFGIAMGVPVLQIIATTIVERAAVNRVR